MGEIRDYSTTADDNNSTPPDGAPEGMAPSSVNNTMREAYARIKRWYEDCQGAKTTTGSSNAYLLAASRVVASYAAGDSYMFKANHTNTSAGSTLNVDSVGAKAIVTPTGAAIAAGSITSGGVYLVAYEASIDKFILIGGSHSSGDNPFIFNSSPTLTLENSTSEDTSGGRESQVVFKGLQSGSEESTLGKITVSHDGSSDDQKGKVEIAVNDGSDNDAPTTALSIGSNLTVTANGDLTVADDLSLSSDGAIINFGADSDVTLTHVADTGLLLNGTSQLQFNDASQNITAPSATVLDINATDEVEINATLADVNANLDVSGTYTGGGLMTTGGNVVIPDAGNIGSASDTDAIAIASGGAVTFSQLPVLPKGTLTNAVLQVVTASNSGTVNTTSSSYADITSVTANITPQNSANKILVLYSSDALYSLTAGANVTYSHKVLRDSTSLGERSITAASGGGGLQSRAPMSLIVLDSPSSTSSLTYKSQHKISNTSSTGSTLNTHITLVEIAG